MSSLGLAEPSDDGEHIIICDDTVVIASARARLSPNLDITFFAFGLSNLMIERLRSD